jgi:Coenzyme PQQ synthesis protein D (PqqD)
MKIRVAEDVIWRHVDDEVLITNVKSAEIFGLDGAGARMWELLAEDGSLDAAAAKLAAEFKASQQRIRRDLEALVSELARRRLIAVDRGGNRGSRTAAPRARPRTRTKR